MSAAELLDALRAGGFTLARQGTDLRVMPARAITDPLRAAIREHKAALLASLADPRAPAEPTVDPGDLVERVGRQMVALQENKDAWSDAEWEQRRDPVLADMDRMEAELARRGRVVQDYGWSFTAAGVWHRLPSSAARRP
jgi:hypothetical protein